eukprot:6558732-Prymnesium_polylepis.1
MGDLVEELGRRRWLVLALLVRPDASREHLEAVCHCNRRPCETRPLTGEFSSARESCRAAVGTSCASGSMASAPSE